MALIECTCAWCGYTAQRCAIAGHTPQVWVCDVCATKWKLSIKIDQLNERLRNLE